MIGIYGGSFDPIHIGHLHAAYAVQQQLNLETVYFVPCGMHAFGKQFAATAIQRRDMCRLTLENHPQLQLDESEIFKPHPSYMVETIHRYQAQFPDESLALLIGQDAAFDLSRWHQSQALLNAVTLIVIKRPGTDGESLHEKLASLSDNFRIVEVDAIDISSTKLRQKLASDENLATYLPQNVWKYIQEQHLYGVK